MWTTLKRCNNPNFQANVLQQPGLILSNKVKSFSGRASSIWNSQTSRNCSKKMPCMWNWQELSRCFFLQACLLKEEMTCTTAPCWLFSINNTLLSLVRTIWWNTCAYLYTLLQALYFSQIRLFTIFFNHHVYGAMVSLQNSSEENLCKVSKIKPTASIPG